MAFAHYDETGFISCVNSHAADEALLAKKGLRQVEVPENVNGITHRIDPGSKAAMPLPPRVKTRREVMAKIAELQAELATLPPDRIENEIESE